MLSACNSSSLILVPDVYTCLSTPHLMRSPELVVDEAIRLTMISSVSKGLPRQFLLIWLNILCSILFHFEVPGGKCETSIIKPSSFANPCSSVFQSLHLLPLLPPPSVVINNRLAFGKRILPISFHQVRIDCTANTAVSLLIPTLTEPSLFAIS